MDGPIVHFDDTRTMLDSQPLARSKNKQSELKSTGNLVLSLKNITLLIYKHK